MNAAEPPIARHELLVPRTRDGVVAFLWMLLVVIAFHALAFTVTPPGVFLNQFGALPAPIALLLVVNPTLVLALTGLLRRQMEERGSGRVAAEYFGRSTVLSAITSPRLIREIAQPIWREFGPATIRINTV